MTISEKILAAHCGREELHAGELLLAKVDTVMGNDVSIPLAIKEFDRLRLDRVFDPDRIVLVPDHFTPNSDVKAAENVKVTKEFARNYGISNYFEVGRMGIEHALLPEQGLVLPGDLVVGADSHTCTYGAVGAFATGVGSTDAAVAIAVGEAWFKVPESIKFVYTGRLPRWVSAKDLILYTIGKIGVGGALYMVMELTGEVIRGLPMDGRFTMCNMAIEAGAKTAIIEPDETTMNYVSRRARRPYEVYRSDADAHYASIIEIDVTDLEPVVALPHKPDNVVPVSQARGIPVDQVVIGSCTNGRLDDLRVAASVVKGKRIHRDVRMLVIPATQQVFRQAMAEGLLDTFVEAGAAVCTPTCGPCLGGHTGVLAAGERCVSTTNRNFVGRMGDASSEVYLAGPAVAAASAVMGRIASPEEVAAYNGH